MSLYRSKTLSLSSSYRVTASPFEALGDSFLQLWSYRGLIWRQITHQFLLPIRNTYLGLVWRIAIPLVPLTVYLFLYRIGVFKSSAEIPWIMYVSIGFCLWGAFGSMLLTATRHLETQAGILTKVRIPFIVSFFSSLGEIGFDLAFRSALVFALSFIVGIENPWNSLFILPLSLPMIALGMALGILASIVNIYAKDIKSLVVLFINYGIYVSGAIFPLPDIPWLKFLKTWNPIYWYQDAARELIVHGTFSPSLLWAAFGSVALLLLSIYRLYAIEPQVIEGM